MENKPRVIHIPNANFSLLNPLPVKFATPKMSNSPAEMLVGLAFIFLLGFSAIMIGLANLVLLGGICMLLSFVFVFVMMFIVPHGGELELDSEKRIVTVARTFSLGFGRWPRRRVETFPYSQIGRVEVTDRRGNAAVQMELLGGPLVRLSFGSRGSLAQEALNRIQRAMKGEESQLAEQASVEQVAVSNVTLQYQKMVKDIRGWQVWLAVIGVITLLKGGLTGGSWGVILILVALTAFKVTEASMYVVFGVVLLEAMLYNLAFGDGLWRVFPIVQLGMAVGVFIQYRGYRKAEQEYNRSRDPQAAGALTFGERLFPIASLVLGLVSLADICAVLTSIASQILVGHEMFSMEILSTFFSYTLDFSMLGLAMGIGALLSKYRRKVLAILGTVFSVLSYLLHVGLIVFSMLS